MQGCFEPMCLASTSPGFISRTGFPSPSVVPPLLLFSQQCLEPSQLGFGDLGPLPFGFLTQRHETTFGIVEARVDGTNAQVSPFPSAQPQLHLFAP